MCLGGAHSAHEGGRSRAVSANGRDAAVAQALGQYTKRSIISIPLAKIHTNQELMVRVGRVCGAWV